MRHSPLRHNLARLRLTIGCGQKEMAALAGCSASAVQAVELGKLPLSKDLARRIADATGADVGWLLDNDLRVPPCEGGKYRPGMVSYGNDPKEHYNLKDFERWRSHKEAGRPDETYQLLLPEFATSFFGQIYAVLSSALKRDEHQLAIWKVKRVLADLRKEFGHDESLLPLPAEQPWTEGMENVEWNTVRPAADLMRTVLGSDAPTLPAPDAPRPERPVPKPPPRKQRPTRRKRD